MNEMNPNGGLSRIGAIGSHINKLADEIWIDDLNRTAEINFLDSSILLQLGKTPTALSLPSGLVARRNSAPFPVADGIVRLSSPIILKGKNTLHRKIGILILFFVISGAAAANNNIHDQELLSIGFGISFLRNKSEITRYLNAFITKNYQDGFLIGGEIGYTQTANKFSHVDGNDFLVIYGGLTVGYKNKLTQKYAYSLEFLSGIGLGESTDVDKDLISSYMFAYLVNRPSASLHMKWSDNVELSLFISRVYANSHGFYMGGLMYSYKW